MQVILPYLISVRLFVVIPSEPGHYEPSFKELPLDFVPWQYQQLSVPTGFFLLKISIRFKNEALRSMNSNLCRVSLDSTNYQK